MSAVIHIHAYSRAVIIVKSGKWHGGARGSDGPMPSFQYVGERIQHPVVKISKRRKKAKEELQYLVFP